jgi:DNA-directed RNA polymerase beta subunit
LAIKNQTARKSFSSIKVVKDYPDFLDIQLQSFKDFFQLDTPAEKRRADGLFKVFAENFPISDSRENFTLEFIDYAVDPPKYSVEECIDRGLTYSVPLKAKLRLLCSRNQMAIRFCMVMVMLPMKSSAQYVIIIFNGSYEQQTWVFSCELRFSANWWRWCAKKCQVFEIFG